MSAHCCDHDLEWDRNNKAFKRILWLSLILNFAMFFVEIVGGVLSHSLSLRADAIDFFGDSLNYAVTLFVMGSALQTKARVSLAKATFMLVFGLWVAVEAVLAFFKAPIPNAFTMSWVGACALIVNVLVAVLLYKYKNGDSNMRSVWLCSRNDALGNLAVLAASAGVYWWGRKWPDLIVALFMAGLAVNGALQIIRSARAELKGAPGFTRSHEHHGHHH